MFLMGLLTTMEEAVAYDKMSDEKLLLRVAEGDKAAFQQLYQNTDKTIYGFILSILRNPQDSVTRSMKRISGFRIFLRWRQGNSVPR